MNVAFLPYGRQTIEDDDLAAVVEALRAPFLTTGPLLERYESAFAQATGATHAVACNSGTAALHLACLAADLGPGKSAIVPSVTFLATANAVRMTGAEVDFADVDAETGLLTPATLEAACRRATASGRKVAAVLPVHLNGQVCDLAGIAEVASSRGLDVIEDACHALGVGNIGANRFSIAACFSTHAIKPITTCEGGVVTTTCSAMARRMRRLRSHGMERDRSGLVDRVLSFDGKQPNPWSYEMTEVGWNYRIPDVLCALGLSQLTKLERFFTARCKLAALYNQLLEPFGQHVRPVPHRHRPHGWHLYAVLIDFEALDTSRARLMRVLQGEGIGTQVHYTPVHRQPYYRRRWGDGILGGAESYYARCLSLPLFAAMTEGDVAQVVDALTRNVER